MIPKRGTYPAVDYLIEKLNCTEVVYITMTPSEKKTQEDEVFKEIIRIHGRVDKMLRHLDVHKDDANNFGSIVSSYVQFIYKEVHK